jgi:hypothetical protein
VTNKQFFTHLTALYFVVEAVNWSERSLTTECTAMPTVQLVLVLDNITLFNDAMTSDMFI